MNRLRLLRNERHITQEELAFELNMSQQQISKVEREITPMGEKLIKACVEYFGVTADYLLGLSDVQVETGISLSYNGGQPDAILQDILYYYESFDRPQRNMIKEIAKVVAESYKRRDR